MKGYNLTFYSALLMAKIQSKRRYQSIGDINICQVSVWFRLITSYSPLLAGIVESDDVGIIHGELNKAYNYAQNVS